MADIFNDEKRSEIMRKVKSKKNKSTELRLIDIFKQNGITGWKRNYPVKGHPEQNRALSMREGALLQSFPPNYQFIDPDHQETNRSIGVHIGNAVPVELGRAIGTSILQHLENMGVV